MWTEEDAVHSTHYTVAGLANPFVRIRFIRGPLSYHEMSSFLTSTGMTYVDFRHAGRHREIGKKFDGTRGK